MRKLLEVTPLGEAEDNILGCVVVVHGLGENAARYLELAWYLARAGYRVVGVDLPGHGPNARKFGISSWARTKPLLFDTLMRERDLAAARFPGAPFFIKGHSLGGQFVSRLAGGAGTAREFAPERGIDGLILCSPFYAPNYRAVLGRKVLIGATSSRGMTPEHRYLFALDVSDSEPHRRMMRDDPYFHGNVNPFLRPAPWNLRTLAGRVRVPVLMGVAADERLVSKQAQHRFAAELRVSISVKEYAALHELHQCEIREQWYQDIVDWMRVIGSKRLAGVEAPSLSVEHHKVHADNDKREGAQLGRRQ